MLLAACARFGAADEVMLVRLGAVVELLHMASLLHDDVVDQAPMRRGAPAAQTVVGGERAILAGLAGFALASAEAAAIGGGLDRLVSRAASGLARGEMLDVERAFDTALPLSDYLEVARRKTGDLFRLSCLLGAAQAGAGPAVGRAVGDFGAEFGVAFQILDDCLDLTAAGTGKVTGADHLLGLFGAPTLLALRADASGELAGLLLSADFGRRDMPKVRELVTGLGGVSAAAQLARDRYDVALSALAGLDATPCAAVVAVASSAWHGC